MELIIYSFFIVAGISGLSYYTIRKRYARLLEEEQDKSYALRNSELLLASEKQRLETAVKEKEQQIVEIKHRISQQETSSSSLSSEVMTKDKQIQSLSAQLQHETSQRTSLEQELISVERQLSQFKMKISEEASKTSSLNADVSSKEQTLRSVTAELQLQQELRSKAEQSLQEKEQTVATLNGQTAELQQINSSLQEELSVQKSATAESQKNILELQHHIEQLQHDLQAARNDNASLHTIRESLSAEFIAKEQLLQKKLSETELYFSATKQELETTAELLKEQTSIREATEHALQESKQKLYTLIGELEQQNQVLTASIATVQDELARRTNDLMAIEQSIHHILRLVPVPVVVVNENGTCEYCNTALEELVGYGMNELSERHFSRLFPEEERSFYEEQWKNTENRAEQFQGETRIIAATNDPISASVSFAAIHPNSDTTKYVGFIVDRTVEKDSKKHFAAAQQREQELLDLKSRFIGMVSNQLRTSLVTIATNTELLERFLDKWSDERRYHSFLRINESIRQMIELVRDVTFTTRTATESYTLNRTSVNLESIMQSTARELAADLESHHHFILTEQGNISSVMLDETLLRTIVTQVLSNAFKYSRDNTEVKASIEQHDGSCVLKISDQGIGIPAAEQKHLFSSFFRASNVSNIYGTGLGLTIAQQCVQLHGGTITVESELHKGTTVTISLVTGTSPR
ncbi:MAG: ATP-binding protein [Bacteroidota bacterium]